MKTKTYKNFRIGSLNVGTMRGRAGKIVETVSRRKISVCAVQETCWKGCSDRVIPGKDSKYKYMWSGDDSGLGGVGLLVVETLIENIISVERINNRIMFLRVMINKIFQCLCLPNRLM